MFYKRFTNQALEYCGKSGEPVAATHQLFTIVCANENKNRPNLEKFVDDALPLVAVNLEKFV